MKLKNYLKALENDTIISIGMRDGQQYMYIGEAGNVELINKVFEEYYESMANRIVRLRAKELELVMTKPKLKGSQAEKQFFAHQYAENVAKIYYRIENIKKFLSSYVNPLERNVIETKDRTCDEGIIITITGLEKGQFWFKSEFDKQNG